MPIHHVDGFGVVEIDQVHVEIAKRAIEVGQQFAVAFGNREQAGKVGCRAGKRREFLAGLIQAPEPLGMFLQDSRFMGGREYPLVDADLDARGECLGALDEVFEFGPRDKAAVGADEALLEIIIRPTAPSADEHDDIALFCRLDEPFQTRDSVATEVAAGLNIVHPGRHRWDFGQGRTHLGSRGIVFRQELIPAAGDDTEVLLVGRPFFGVQPGGAERHIPAVGRVVQYVHLLVIGGDGAAEPRPDELPIQTGPNVREAKTLLGLMEQHALGGVLVVEDLLPLGEIWRRHQGADVSCPHVVSAVAVVGRKGHLRVVGDELRLPAPVGEGDFSEEALSVHPISFLNGQFRHGRISAGEDDVLVRGGEPCLNDFIVLLASGDDALDIFQMVAPLAVIHVAVAGSRVPSPGNLARVLGDGPGRRGVAQVPRIRRLIGKLPVLDQMRRLGCGVKFPAFDAQRQSVENHVFSGLVEAVGVEREGRYLAPRLEFRVPLGEVQVEFHATPLVFQCLCIAIDMLSTHLHVEADTAPEVLLDVEDYLVVGLRAGKVHVVTQAHTGIGLGRGGRVRAEGELALLGIGNYLQRRVLKGLPAKGFCRLQFAEFKEIGGPVRGDGDGRPEHE